MNKLNNKLCKPAIGYMGLAIIVVLVYVTIPNSAVKLKASQLKNIEYTNDLLWSIDTVNTDTEYIKIEGWAIKQYQNTDKQNVSVFIKNINTGKYYKTNTNIVKRPDLNKAFIQDNVDYSFGGFTTTFKKNKLKDKIEKYTIILQYKNDDKILFIDTNRKLQS